MTVAHFPAWLAQAPAPAVDEGTTVWEMVREGGTVGYVIMGLSIVAVALIVMHLLQIRRRALMPPMQLQDLDDLLGRGDVNSALEYCVDPANDSYMTRILATGLTRYQKSAFGAFEIKNALEEAGEDHTARLYRSTDAIGVIGAIAPLLGLLGTVFGMVGAFDALGKSAAADSERLASEISMALITTLMGLILAIPCIALYTFFRNRIDAFASEAAMDIERLTLHLESVPGAAPPGPRRTPARPAAPPRPAAPSGGSPAS